MSAKEEGLYSENDREFKMWIKRFQCQTYVSTVIFIFGKGHLSTLGASRDKFFFLLLSAICNRKKNQKTASLDALKVER